MLLFSHFTKSHTEPKQRKEEMGACRREGVGQKSKSCCGKIPRRCCCQSSDSENKAITKATVGRKQCFMERPGHTPLGSPTRDMVCSGVQKNRHCPLGIFINSRTQVMLTRPKVERCSHRTDKHHRIQSKLFALNFILPLPSIHGPLAQLSRFALWTISGVGLLLS